MHTFLVHNLIVLFREKILVGHPEWDLHDARIDLSWLRSRKGCPKHDLFTLEYSKCAKL